MAREMVAYCDVCKKPDAIEWNVAQAGDGHWVADLCAEHGAIVESIVSQGRKVEHVKPGRVRNRYSAYVRGVPTPPTPE